ncbi:hypothetical protein PR048_016006 [Dryococelus australis]|uniref:Uncharacterized protein n=1 Tax=Dryococelus australis TaxID=614101 RepID=A0ABQ9HIK2_9NEOP|nr:hypothetical protein PR048_016006 [Dryococelus australis]
MLELAYDNAGPNRMVNAYRRGFCFNIANLAHMKPYGGSPLYSARVACGSRTISSLWHLWHERAVKEQDRLSIKCRLVSSRGCSPLFILWPAHPGWRCGGLVAHCCTLMILMHDGAMVAEWLAYSPPTKAIQVQFPAGSLWILACGNSARQWRWSNARETGDPRENPLTSDIVRNDSHLKKSTSRHRPADRAPGPLHGHVCCPICQNGPLECVRASDGLGPASCSEPDGRFATLEWACLSLSMCPAHARGCCPMPLHESSNWTGRTRPMELAVCSRTYLGRRKACGRVIVNMYTTQQHSTILELRSHFVVRFPPSMHMINQLLARFRQESGVIDHLRSRRPRSVIIAHNIEHVRQSIVDDAETSIRRRSTQFAISQRSLQRIVHRMKMFPYKMQLVQEL